VEKRVKEHRENLARLVEKGDAHRSVKGIEVRGG